MHAGRRKHKFDFRFHANTLCLRAEVKQFSCNVTLCASITNPHPYLHQTCMQYIHQGGMRQSSPVLWKTIRDLCLYSQSAQCIEVHVAACGSNCGVDRKQAINHSSLTRAERRLDASVTRKETWPLQQPNEANRMYMYACIRARWTPYAVAV